MDGAHVPKQREHKVARANNRFNNLSLNSGVEKHISTNKKSSYHSRANESKSIDNSVSQDPTIKPSSSSSRVDNDIFQQNIETSPKNRDFSSRNSLRSAQAQPTEKNIVFNESSVSKMTFPLYDDRQSAYLDQFGIEGSSYYVPINSACFFRELGDFMYCLLCGTRKRKRVQLPDKHLASQSHINKFLELRSALVRRRPHDDSLHMRALSILLSRWYQESALTMELSTSRLLVVDEFSQILMEIQPKCGCRLIGSLLSGTSLRTSDVNLELIHPNSGVLESDPRAKNSIHHKLVDPNAEYGNQVNHHSLHFDLIDNASEALYKVATTISSGYLSNHNFTVQSGIEDLNTKVPKLRLFHELTRTTLEICCYASVNYRLSNLYRIYVSLDGRARELSIIVKRWANLCRISDPKQGTYPPDTFVLLVIYFLQRTNPPILPCLHELAKLTKSDEYAKAPRSETENLIDNFEKLQVDSNKTFDTLGEACNELKNGNKGSSEDEINEEEVDEEEEEEAATVDFDQDFLESLTWASSNTSEVHSLFIDFLSFMMTEFDNRSTVISIRTLDTVPLEIKGWNTQVKAIENPVKPRLNISRCIGSYRTFEYIKSCFKYGFCYLTSLPLDMNRRRIVEPQADPEDYIEQYVNLERLDRYFIMRERSISSNASYDSVQELVLQNLFARDVNVIQELVDFSLKNNSSIEQLPSTIARMYNEQLLSPNDRASTIFCWLCRGIGHIRQDCPKGLIEKLQRELETYDARLDNEANFDNEFWHLYESDSITPELSRQHHQIVAELKRIIRKATGLKCELQLFGSTVNLLGTCDSDLDICMTIENNLTGKGVKSVQILRDVNLVLSKLGIVKDIEPILSARVPILKFKYARFNVDLSMYNQCAIHNSRLLKSYVLKDDRVAILCYLVKRFAKSCGIADASRGSLSSYAWSLMVIHFLQQVEPPVLPVLQETHKNGVKPLVGVNGWNVWFNDDLNSFEKTRNHSNVTQLFKQFFLYYGNFDFNHYVISIRTSRKMTKFEKNWNNCMIAIEDPFELTYNLSGRLDDPMSIYIMNSFTGAYRHIVNIQDRYLSQSGAPSLETIKRIFNAYSITKTSPPFRGCRSCHRIGHKYKDCPEVRRQREQLEQRRRARGNNIGRVDSRQRAQD